MKLFNGTKPTVADVDTERGKLESERQDVRTRQQAIENAIADAYGTDTSTAELEREYAALQAKLSALAIVERRLASERTDAAKRAALAQYQAAVEAIAADWQALKTIQPKREQAARAYFALLTEENKIRGRLRMVDDRQGELIAALAQIGLTTDAVAADVAQIDTSISDYRNAIVLFVQPDGTLS